MILTLVVSTGNTIHAVIKVERNAWSRLRSHATSIELSLWRYQSSVSALCRGPCRLSVCVTLSTGRWRDRKWQVVARLTWQDILVSVFTLVFWLLAFFAGIQQFALLLLKNLIAHEKEISSQDDDSASFWILITISSFWFKFTVYSLRYLKPDFMT